MADIVCPRCNHTFGYNNPESLVTRTAAGTAGAATGAWFGGGIGIVGGPATGIAGTIPGGIAGFLVWLGRGRPVSALPEMRQDIQDVDEMPPLF